MDCPQNLKYTKEHEWVLMEGGSATIGITDYAQGELGDVVFVELPETGAELTADNTFGVVESVKSVSDLYAPISGKVTETNAELEAEPERVNQSPYGDGWMIKIEPSDPAQVDGLLSADDYKAYVESL